MEEKFYNWLKTFNPNKYYGESVYVDTNALNTLRTKYEEIFSVKKWFMNNNRYVSLEDSGYTVFKPFNELDLRNLESKFDYSYVKVLEHINNNVSWIINCLEGLLFPKIGIMKENEHRTHIYDMTNVNKFPFTSAHQNYCDIRFSEIKYRAFKFKYTFDYEKFINIDVFESRYSYKIMKALIDELSVLNDKEMDESIKYLLEAKRVIYRECINKWINIKINRILREIIESNDNIEKTNVGSYEFECKESENLFTFILTFELDPIELV